MLTGDMIVSSISVKLTIGGYIMIRKIIKIVAAILSIILIISGIYKVLVTGSNDWGLIIVGAFFLIAIGPDVYDSIKI